MESFLVWFLMTSRATQEYLKVEIATATEN